MDYQQETTKYRQSELVMKDRPIFQLNVETLYKYKYPDFIDSNEEFIEFDSYIVPDSDLEDGGLRMLEVDNRVIVPELTHIRFVITSGDVIHSFACPSLGIKCDAYPGRLNQVSVFINREGVFYGNRNVQKYVEFFTVQCL
ncbi:unnamed protein product, partial [Fusarium graminearum]